MNTSIGHLEMLSFISAIATDVARMHRIKQTMSVQTPFISTPISKINDGMFSNPPTFVEALGSSATGESYTSLMSKIYNPFTHKATTAYLNWCSNTIDEGADAIIREVFAVPADTIDGEIELLRKAADKFQDEMWREPSYAYYGGLLFSMSITLQYMKDSRSHTSQKQYLWVEMNLLAKSVKKVVSLLASGHDVMSASTDLQDFNIKNDATWYKWAVLNIPVSTAHTMYETALHRKKKDKLNEDIPLMFKRIVYGIEVMSTGKYVADEKRRAEERKEPMIPDTLDADRIGHKNVGLFDYSEFMSTNMNSAVNKIDFAEIAHAKEYGKMRAVFWMVLGGYVTPSSPVIFNSGLEKVEEYYDGTEYSTAAASSVSCVLLTTSDDIRNIGKMVQDVMVASSNGSGVSVNISSIRAGGTPVGKGGEAPSPTVYLAPLHLMNVAYSQGNKRSASIAVSIAAHHMSAMPVITMHKPTASVAPMHSMFANIVVNDALLHAAKNGEKWLQISPSIFKRSNRSKRLYTLVEQDKLSQYNNIVDADFSLEKFIEQDLMQPSIYDDLFSLKYYALTKLAEEEPSLFKAICGRRVENDEEDDETFGKYYSIVDADEFLNSILNAAITTGKVWITFHDAMNRGFPLEHAINSTNLCTEIGIPNMPAHSSLEGYEGHSLGAICVITNVNFERMTRDVYDENNKVVTEFDPDMLQFASRVALDIVNAVNLGSPLSISENHVFALMTRPVGVSSYGIIELAHRLNIRPESLKFMDLNHQARFYMMAATYERSAAAATYFRAAGVIDVDNIAYPHGHDKLLRTTRKNGTYRPLDSRQNNDLLFTLHDGSTGSDLVSTYAEKCSEAGYVNPFTSGDAYLSYVNGQTTPLIGDRLPFNVVRTTGAPTASSAAITDGRANEFPKMMFPNRSTSKIQAPTSSEFYFVQMLKKHGVKMSRTLLDNIVRHKGSVQHIAALCDVPDKEAFVQDLEAFKTGFEVNPYFQIAITASAQSCVDQAISHFTYLESVADSQLFKSLVHNLRMSGCKSVYYVYTLNDGNVDATDVLLTDAEEEIAPKQCLINDPSCVSCQ